MSKLVSAAVRIDDPNRRMVELGFYYLLGPDGSIILPSTWEEVIEPGWSLTIQMWPMQNDKVDDDRPNTKLIGSSELGYTHKTQFENVDPLNPYFHRSNPGFVESLNAPEEVQSAAAFSKGSNTESMDPRAVHALDSHAGSPHTGVAPSRKSRSESISWDHPINDQSSEASRPISAQREGTTPKGKQPLNVGSNDWGSWGLKQSSATQLRHGQSKNKVAQPDVSFEKESQEPQTPAKSGAPANVENLIVSSRVYPELALTDSLTLTILNSNPIPKSPMIPLPMLNHRLSRNNLTSIRVLTNIGVHPSIGIHHFPLHMGTSLGFRLEGHQNFFLISTTSTLLNLFFRKTLQLHHLHHFPHISNHLHHFPHISNHLHLPHSPPIFNPNHLTSSRNMCRSWSGPQRPTQTSQLQVSFHPLQKLAASGQSEQQLSQSE